MSDIVAVGKLEEHPAIEYIYEFINKGHVIIEDSDIDTANLLCETLNTYYPQYKLYPAYITRLKKRIRRAEGGYMLKDNQVFYADGRLLQPLPIKSSLEIIMQIALEQAVAHPEIVQVKDALKAIELIKRYKDLSDPDEFTDVWSAFVKTGGVNPEKRGRKKIIVPEEQPEIPAPPPELAALEDEELESNDDFSDSLDDDDEDDDT